MNTVLLTALVRWGCVIPGALAFSWIAWLAITVGNRWSMGYVGMDSEWIVSRVITEILGHAAAGAAFIYAGIRIAPSSKRYASYFLFSLCLLASGLLLFPAISGENWWAVIGGISLSVGAGAFTLQIADGDVDPEAL